MKYTRTIKEEVEVTHLIADMDVRYWEDANVNGENEDDDNPKMPFATKDGWRIVVGLATGVIADWPQGVVASTHYKVCDAGVYSLIGNDGGVVMQKSGYVPDMLAPSGDGYGDYVILDIDATGRISGWNPDMSYFDESEDD